MNLSNKILLAFFGFIFLYLTAAFVEIRVSGTPNIISDKNSKAETVDISGVNYLILNDVDKQVNVIGSDRAQLEVRSLTGDLLSKLEYQVSGDTLILSGLQSEEIKTMKISVFVPKGSLKGIVANRSEAIVKGLQRELFHISQKAGSILISDCRIEKLELDLTTAYLDISHVKMDTVSATIQTSTVNIFAPIGLLKGTMKNGSFLRLDDIGEIRIKKDESSRLSLD